MIKILIALCVSAMIFAFTVRGAEPEHTPSLPGDPTHVEIPNMRPAGPGDFANDPILWVGVKACGNYVIWLVFEDHISVIDKDHRPKDWKGFLHDLEQSKIPSDERVIPCSSESL